MPDVRLIDANALVEKFQSYYESLSPDVYSELIRRDEVSSCIAELINAPTIDAQPVKQGHWIRKYIYYVCSECGIKLIDDNFEQIAIFPRGYMPFCPVCSTKMNGVHKCWRC